MARVAVGSDDASPTFDPHDGFIVWVAAEVRSV